MVSVVGEGALVAFTRRVGERRLIAGNGATPPTFALTPFTRTGGIQLASSRKPPGRPTATRGRGTAKSRSVLSGPFPGRQIVGVRVAASSVGR
jgi:hypothetical protein